MSPPLFYDRLAVSKTLAAILTTLTIYLQALNAFDREAWLSPWKLCPAAILCENLDLVDLGITFTLQKLTTISARPWWSLQEVTGSLLALKSSSVVFVGQPLVDRGKSPSQQRGSLPVPQVPIRLTNIWYGRPDGIMGPLPSRGWFESVKLNQEKEYQLGLSYSIFLERNSNLI